MYDWNDLRIFLAVARSGSALAAARELNLNQTTVTRRMDALEHALGTHLFLRGARGSALTEHGQALVPRAEAVEAAALMVDGEASRLRRDLSGEIRVTAPEAIMMLFVGPLTLRFRESHPGVRFDYISAEHRLDIAKGDADIAFRAGGVLEGDTLVCQALPDIAWTAYAAEGLARRRGVPCGWGEMTGYPIVGYAGSITTMQHLRQFHSKVRPEDLVGSSNNVPNMTGMIRAGVGFGILPCIVGDMQRDLVRCFPPPEGLSTPWWLVASREANELKRVREFMSFAADQLRRMRGALSGELDQAAARARLEGL
jgi:DNA-binding transcriptional LysR family regulator